MTSNYDATFPHNLSVAMKNLQNKNIFYSVQYLTNREVECDRDGVVDSSWNINVLCIERERVERVSKGEEFEYIFHFNSSDEIYSSYSCPHYVNVDNFTLHSKKLSDLENDFYNVGIDDYLQTWYDDYSYALNTNDLYLSEKLIDLNIIFENKYAIISKNERDERDKNDKKNKEFLEAVYKIIAEKDAEDMKKEEERLKLLITLYGEVEGKKYFRL